ncbi:MAG: DUF3289 family protein [Peptococcaceae bacterium]|nr:DUF3289 family protein [Peptococcaceae bacterium]
MLSAKNTREINLQRNKIEILSYSKTGNDYSGTMRNIYYDYFGLDPGDFISDGYGSITGFAVTTFPGFRNWFILQRWKDLNASVHLKPFITTMEFEENFSGKI